MSEFFFNLIAVSGKIGEGVHIVCSNVLVGGASSPSLTGKMPVPQRVIFFGMGFYPVSNRQDACSTNSEFFWMGFYPVSNRQDACSTKSYFFWDGSILPT